MKKKINKEDINVVLYHANCPDGFCAAWAARNKLGDKAKYIPVVHGDTPPYDEIEGKNVALVDFCYPRTIMRVIVNTAKSVVVIDHHVSAMKDMDGFEGEQAQLNFDMIHSGCVLSWRYFNSKKPIPQLLLAVEARDLWKPDWEDKYGAYLSGLDSYGYHDFDLLTEFVYESNDIYGCQQLEDEGNHIERFRKILVEDHAKRSVNGLVSGHYAKIVNCSSKELVSEIGNKICSDGVIGVVWWFDHRIGQAIVSFRSKGDIDVSEIAKHFGGGGHRPASGCCVPMSIIHKWEQK